MNQMIDIESDDHEIVDLADSPGRRLRLQRQSRGVEIERIAAQLHLRNDIVEALEQDRYDVLPAPVYIAGYLRNYARLIGLDPTLIVDAYYKSAPHADHRPILVKPSPRPPRNGRFGSLLFRLISVMMVAAVIGMLILWWQNNANLDPEFNSGLLPSLFGQSQTAAGNEEPILADASSADDVAPLEQEAVESDAAARRIATSVDPSDGGLPTPTPTPPIPLATQESAPLPERSPTASDRLQSQPPQAVTQPLSGESVEEPETAIPNEVVLEFSGASWVSIMGSDGNTVLNREMREGDRHILKGAPPFKFVIGNAAATRMTVGGQPFDLIGRSRGNVARFSFDPAAPQ